MKPDALPAVNQDTELPGRRLAELEKAPVGGTDGTREMREVLGRLVEALPHFVVIVTPEGRPLYLNQGGGQLTGHDPARVAALALADFFPAEAYAEIVETGIPAAQRAGLWESETRLRTKTGNEIPVTQMILAHRADDGALKFLAMIARDISLRKQTEEILREQAALLEQAHDAVVVKDMDDRILRWSAGATRIYGWDAEVVGRINAELLQPEDAAYAEALRTTREVGSWSGELHKKTKAGRVLIVDSRWTLIRNAEGRPYCILSIDSDVTEQRRLQAQFLRAQRMESIGALAGGIAHDLNNVLAPVLMGVGLLRLKVGDPDGQRTLDTVERSAQRGANLVRQVLSFARGAEGGRSPVSVATLVREIASITIETFPKSIVTETHVAADAWSVVGDMTQLHQVLLNLCVNSRDAMAQGGRLGITATNVALDENYAGMNPESRPGPHVVIEVSDTGAGIPPEIRTKIFEPFFTTKAQGHGTGLGLSTVYAIVKGHGGFINVYSEVGKGTQIKIYLPAQPGQTDEATPIEQRNLPRGHGETVLVVEDEESIGQIVQHTLERYGYKVLLAGNGAEAVAIYARRDPVVDVVLTDMAMPIMDGPATVLALRKIDPKVRIIGASGLGSNSKFVHAFGAGLKFFLHKPYTAESLLQNLRRVLSEAP